MATRNIGCGYGLIGFWLFFTNFLILVIGIAIVIISVLLITGETNSKIDILHSAFAFNPQYLSVPLYIALALGSFTVLYSFLGCCGTLSRSTAMLTLFLILAVIGLVINGSGIGLAVWGNEQVTSWINSYLQPRLSSNLQQASNLCKILPVEVRQFCDCQNPVDQPFCDVFSFGGVSFDVGRVIQMAVNSGQINASQLETLKNIQTLQNDLGCCGINSPFDYKTNGAGIFYNVTQCSPLSTEGCIPVAKTLLLRVEMFALIGFSVLAGVIFLNIIFALVYYQKLSAPLQSPQKYWGKSHQY
eukprot:Sdes_comp21627_c0_seq1m20219